MSTGVRGMARLTFHDGGREEFERLSTRLIDLMREKDRGTLSYEIYIDDEGSEVVFLEHFEDSDALIEHNGNVAEVLQAALATGTVTAAVFGPASAELKAMSAGAPVRFYTLLRSL
jgi:quinol monooxygenase YgiN